MLPPGQDTEPASASHARTHDKRLKEIIVSEPGTVNQTIASSDVLYSPNRR